MFGTRETFHYYQCSQCGCIQIGTIPADLSRHYPPHYYSFQGLTPAPSTSGLVSSLRQGRNRAIAFAHGDLGRLIARATFASSIRWELYRHFPGRTFRSLGLRPTSMFVDVGSGGGGLLCYLADQLGLRQLLGIDEFISHDITYGNGVRILRRSLSELEVLADIVMFHHSFEHMPDPHSALRAACRLLRPSGVCLVRIPVLGEAWKRYGPNWVQFDAPRHLYLHSVRSMERLAADSGFSVERVIWDSTAFQFWGSEQYQHDVPLTAATSYSVNPDASLFTREQIRRFEERAEHLNRAGEGDQAAFYLRKQ